MAVYMQVDRFGRKVLLFASGLVVSVSMAAMGAFFYMQKQWGPAEATAKLGWLPLVSLMVFFAAYSSGYANVPFIIMGEMLPSRFRSILGPASSSFNLLCTFAVVRGYPSMRDAMGAYGTFWFFMCCTLVSLVFIFFLLPETKGKTLDEIERMFSNKAEEQSGIPRIPRIQTISSGSNGLTMGHDNLGFQPGEDQTIKKEENFGSKVDDMDFDSDLDSDTIVAVPL